MEFELTELDMVLDDEDLDELEEQLQERPD